MPIHIYMLAQARHVLLLALLLSAICSTRAQQRQVGRVTILGSLPVHGGGACSSDWDCALGGTCTGTPSKCTCDPWWTGSNCTLLNLQPAKAGNGFDLTELRTGGDTFHGAKWTGWSSWGGHAVYDNSTAAGDAPWVGVFSLMARGCGLHDYHSNSESVIATAKEVDGPFVLNDPDNPDSPTNIAVPAPSHCTQIKRHPSGEYHLWHIFPGGADNASSPDAGPPELTCTNGTSKAESNTLAPPPPPHPCPTSGCISPVGQQLFVHTAPSPRGPWTVHGSPIKLETVNATTITQASCTAPFYHTNGSSLLVVGGGACPQGWGGSGGAHGGGGGCLWAFEGDSWKGPYFQQPRPEQGSNPGDPITHPENEDPAVFIDPVSTSMLSFSNLLPACAKGCVMCSVEITTCSRTSTLVIDDVVGGLHVVGTFGAAMGGPGVTPSLVHLGRRESWQMAPTSR